MHGRPRTAYKAAQRDPATAAALATKARKWQTLCAQIPTPAAVLSSSSSSSSLHDDYENLRPIGLALTGKLLTINPDSLYLWNVRRSWLLLQPQQQPQQQQQQKEKGGKQETTDAAAAATASTASRSTPTNHEEDDADQEKGDLWKEEWAVTQAALSANPKAYGAWFHRKWCWRQQAWQQQDPPGLARRRLAQEFQWLTPWLQKDERNFHAWNYRHFLVSCRLFFMCRPPGANDPLPLHDDGRPDGSWPGWSTSPPSSTDAEQAESRSIMGAQVARTSPTVFPPSQDDEADPRMDQKDGLPSRLHSEGPVVDYYSTEQARFEILRDEWDFCTTKIRENFSNCSAFHYRSTLLPMWLASLTTTATGTSDFLPEELTLVEDAIFTEPDDQTVWWYHRFLLETFFGNEERPDDAVTAASPWARESSWDRLQTHASQLEELTQEAPHSKWVWLGYFHVLPYLADRPGSATEASGAELRKQQRDILQRLGELDPDRQGRYRFLLTDLAEVDPEVL